MRQRTHVSERLKTAVFDHRIGRHTPLSFDNRSWMLPIYNDDSDQIVIKKSSQCGITEWAIVDMMTLARNDIAGLYVLPTDEWRNTFVPNRIDRAIEFTPSYKASEYKPGRGGDRTKPKNPADNKGMKTFYDVNWKFVGSRQRYNFYEFPAGALLIDEFDLCDQKNLVYAKDRLGASSREHIRKFGNPTIKHVGIDAEFDNSKASEWKVKCGHCNEWQPLDWFANFVVEADNGGYELRDNEARAVCRKCDRPIDRLAAGEWVPQYADTDVAGYHVSKLFADARDLPVVETLYGRFIDAQSNQTELQRFYNNDLGVAFNAKGASLSESMLAACVDPDYTMPLSAVDTVAGVDVGSVHNVRIDKINRDDKGRRQRKAVFIGTVRSYEELDRVVSLYGVQVGVIDAQGEIHPQREFVASHPGWLLCYYNKGADNVKDESVIDYKHSTVRVNRTESLDRNYSNYAQGTVILPRDFRSIDGGAFVEQMTASTRIFKEPTGNSQGTGRYVWDEGSKPDHYFHADNYCNIAADIYGGDECAVMVV